MLAAVLVDVRNEESRFLHPLHDQFARAVPAIALEAVEAQIFRRDQPVGGLGDIGLAIEHRSEEHTSELQSLMRISYAVFCLKKKKKIRHTIQQHHMHNKIDTHN